MNDYTRIPNGFLDEIMSRLSPPEIIVYLYIARRTYGFNRRIAAISLAQFQHGLTTKSGKVLDSGTGLSRSTIVLALRSLEAYGIIRYTPNGFSKTRYEMVDGCANI